MSSADGFGYGAIKFSLYANTNIQKQWKAFQRNVTPRSIISYNYFINHTIEDARHKAPKLTGYLRSEIKYKSRGYLKGSFSTIAIDGDTEEDYGYIRHEYPAKKYTTKGTGIKYLENAFRRQSEILLKKLMDDLLR